MKEYSSNERKLNLNMDNEDDVATEFLNDCEKLFMTLFFVFLAWVVGSLTMTPIFLLSAGIESLTGSEWAQISPFLAAAYLIVHYCWVSYFFDGSRTIWYHLGFAIPRAPLVFLIWIFVWWVGDRQVAAYLVMGLVFLSSFAKLSHAKEIIEWRTKH